MMTRKQKCKTPRQYKNKYTQRLASLTKAVPRSYKKNLEWSTEYRDVGRDCSECFSIIFSFFNEFLTFLFFLFFPFFFLIPKNKDIEERSETHRPHAPIIENSQKKRTPSFRNMYSLLNQRPRRTVRQTRWKWVAYQLAGCYQCSPGWCCCSTHREAATNHHQQRP